MKLEEAIKILLYLKNDLDKIVKRNAEIDDSGIDDNISTAIETVLKALEEKDNEIILQKVAKEEIEELLENSVSKDQIREVIENEVIDVSGFKCIAVEDLEDLLKEE